MGISQVPEGRQIFNPLTVLDNLKLGSYIRYSQAGRKKIQQDMDELFSLFPHIEGQTGTACRNPLRWSSRCLL